jgi:hypothetical protein
MTSRELSAVCFVWQKRLRLSDWRIEVVFVGDKELPKKKYGDIAYDRSSKEAKIRILRPGAMRRRFGKSPVEGTLVHELGHLIMPDITPENEEAIEAAIDFYSEALTNAYDS